MGKNARAYFRLLEREKSNTEGELGAELEWRLLPKSGRIFLNKDRTDPGSRSDWPSQHAWLAENLERFHHTFSPRIKTLDAGEYESELEELSG